MGSMFNSETTGRILTAFGAVGIHRKFLGQFNFHSHRPNTIPTLYKAPF
jgi:hypothetical protein